MQAILISGHKVINRSVCYECVVQIPGFARQDEFSKRYSDVRDNPWSGKQEYYGNMEGGV